MENSDSQNALYEVLAEEGRMTGDTGNSSRRNLLYWEAKEYAKFRNIIKQKGGFIFTQIEHNVQIGYNITNRQYLIGPFEVDYERYYYLGNSEGNIKKADFSGIGIAKGTQISTEKAIRIYDQNGNLINPNSWELVYSDKEKIEGRETYTEYPMPYPVEKFWIKLNRNGNESVTEISKIEVQYYEMQASAEYTELTGKFNTIRWKPGAVQSWCEGGSMCPHGYTVRHVVGHTYYLGTNAVSPAQDSQPLLEIIKATRAYETYTQTLKIVTERVSGDNNESSSGDGSGSGEDSGDSDIGVGRLTINLGGNYRQWNKRCRRSRNKRSRSIPI